MTKYIIREAKVKYSNYKKVKSIIFKCPLNIFDWFKNELTQDANENLLSVYLNPANEVIGFTRESEGCENQSAVYPRKIVRNALLNNAIRVCLVHNHPSGNLEASDDDKYITEKIKKALALLEIELVDHIIIGDNRYYSMKEEGVF